MNGLSVVVGFSASVILFWWLVVLVFGFDGCIGFELLRFVIRVSSSMVQWWGWFGDWFSFWCGWFNSDWMVDLFQERERGRDRKEDREEREEYFVLFDCVVYFILLGYM